MGLDPACSVRRERHQYFGSNETRPTFTSIVADGSLCLSKWHGSQKVISVLNIGGDLHSRPSGRVHEVLSLVQWANCGQEAG